MDLARHKSINLTMARYSHTLVTDKAKVLDVLPSLDGKTNANDKNGKTGTDD